jgi:hypothetical protein
MEKADPAFSLVLSQLFWADKTTFKYCVANFYPPLTILHVSSNDGKNRVIISGADRNKDATIDFMASGNLLSLLTAFSVVRRATGAYFDQEMRLCHHRDCPQFKANYCNLYPVIPARWQDCGFTDRVHEVIQIAGRTK